MKAHFKITTPSVDALREFVAIDFVSTLIDSQQDLDEMINDAKELHLIFTPARILFNQGNGTIHEKMFDLTDLQITPPDAIFILGNNDLNQITHVTKIYRYLQKNNLFLPPLYISGGFGHGTTSGFQFNAPEAEILAQEFIYAGIPREKIIIENKAQNTGENIKFIAGLIPLDHQPKHILISGTPAAALRQLRTFEMQYPLPWLTVCCLPPDWNKLTKKYYSNKSDTAINFLCLLREVATYFDYAVTEKNEKSFISQRPILKITSHSEVSDDAAIKYSFSLLIKYFSRLKKHTANQGRALINLDKLYEEYIGYSHNRNINSCKFTLAAIARFFRLVFKNVEAREMKQLAKSSQKSELHEKTNTVFSQLGLFPSNLDKTNSSKSKTIQAIRK